MARDKKVSVLFVCMGNICRSPMGQGVFERLVTEAGLSEHIHVDSAGTHAYHVGERPDPRARETARSRGYDLSRQRARRVDEQDLQTFDYVIAMDYDNLRHLTELEAAQEHRNLKLFLEYAEMQELVEVPDPYYGGARGFERVLDLVEDAARGLLEDIRRTHGL